MPEKAVDVFIHNFLKKQQVRAKNTGTDDKTSLFNGISEESLQLLLSSSHMKDFTTGQMIVEQGDQPAHLSWIVSGRTKTLRYSPEGNEATIRMLGKGETFMDAVIFMGGPSPIGVRALEDTTVLMIPAESVRRHALHDSQFACNLLKIVTKHYRDSIQQIDSIVTKTPVERLGYYFLKLHLDQGIDNLDISLPFQKSTIANYLGMTPETFSRALNQIKKSGIEIKNDEMTMKDAFVLCHFCDTDTAAVCPKFNTSDCPLCTGGNGKGCH